MNELTYDLALLGAGFLLVVTGGALAAFTGVDGEIATAMIAGGTGVLGARSGRAAIERRSSG